MGSSVEILSMNNDIPRREPEAYEGLFTSAPKSTMIPSIKQMFSQARRVLPLMSASSETKAHPERQSMKATPFTRTPPFPIENLPGALPEAHVDENVDHAAIVSSCLNDLNQLKPGIFTEGSIWRDVYALTGTVRTFNGPESIQFAWKELSDVHHPSGFALTPGTSKIVRLGAKSSWIQARFSFETAGQPETLCSGQIGLVPDSSSGWKIWLLTTILEEIKGFPNPDYIGPQAENGSANFINGAHESSHFDCVVVGAGFAGLCLAGRLKAMGIPSVTLERNAHVGDKWTNRYESARCNVFPSTSMKSRADNGGSPHIQRL
jgi:hypothetical protein